MSIETGHFEQLSHGQLENLFAALDSNKALLTFLSIRATRGDDSAIKMWTAYMESRHFDVVNIKWEDPNATEALTDPTRHEQQV